MVFIFVFFLCYFFDVRIKYEVLSSVLSFLAIFFGFNTVSISILLSSKRIQELYKSIDPKIRTQRKIHTLSSYYLASTMMNLLAISINITLIIIVKNTAIMKISYIDIFCTYASYILISLSFMLIFLATLLLKINLISLIEEGKP